MLRNTQDGAPSSSPRYNRPLASEDVHCTVCSRGLYPLSHVLRVNLRRVESRENFFFFSQSPIVAMAKRASYQIENLTRHGELFQSSLRPLERPSLAR